MEGYIEYQRREFCKDGLCPSKCCWTTLQRSQLGTPRSEEFARATAFIARMSSTTGSLRKGYLITRPALTSLA